MAVLLSGMVSELFDDRLKGHTTGNLAVEKFAVGSLAVGNFTAHCQNEKHTVQYISSL